MEDPVGSEAREDIRAIREFYGYAIGLGVVLSLDASVPVAPQGNPLAFPFKIMMGRDYIPAIDRIALDSEARITKLGAYWDSTLPIRW